MMFQRIDQYRQFELNPFRGERSRVFERAPDVDAAAGGTSRDIFDLLSTHPEDQKLRNHIVKENSFVSDIMGMVPSGKIAYELDRGESVDHIFRNYQSRHNAMESHIQWLEAYAKSIRSNERIDWNSTVWAQRLASLDKAYASAGRLDFFNRTDQLDPLRTRLEGQLAEAQRRDRRATELEIAQEVQTAARLLKQAQEAFEKEVKIYIQHSFEMRVEWLKEKVVSDPPKSFKEVPGDAEKTKKAKKEKAQWEHTIHQVEHALHAQLGPDKDMSEFRNVWQDLDRLEDVYLNKMDAEMLIQKKGVELEPDQLEARRKALEHKRQHQVAHIQERYTKQYNQTRSELISLIELLEATPPERFEKAEDGKTSLKDEAIEKLRKNLKELESSSDLEATTLAVLDSDKLMYEDNRPEDKTVNNMKKGLKQQIERLNSPDFSEDEKEAWAVGIDQALTQFEKYLDNENNLLDGMATMQEQIARKKRSINAPKPGGGALFGYKVVWIAPSDLSTAFDIISHWATEAYSRSSQNRLGTFGSDALKFLNSKNNPLRGWLGPLQNEFIQKKQHSEHEMVEKHKGNLHHLDPWEVEEIAFNTKNKDLLKACLLTLAEHGHLRWDNAELLMQFNLLQNKVYFDPDLAAHLNDIGEFHRKLNLACSAIWEANTFREMDQANTNGYAHKTKEYDNRIHLLADGPGLETTAMKILQQYKDFNNGKTTVNPKEDPLFFDRLIEYSVEKGKMSAEIKLYLLIQGIAEGILPADRGSYYNANHLNTYPPLEFFGANHKVLGYDHKPNLELIRKIAQMDYDTFIDFFYSYIMTRGNVRERANKTITQRNKLDHDDIISIFPLLSSGSIDTLLKEHGDGVGLPVTGIENATAVLSYYMRHYADHAGEEELIREEDFVTFLGAFTRFSGITQGRMYKGSKGYFRFASDSLKKQPRQANNFKDQYGQKGQSVQKNLVEVEASLKDLDKDFFGFLFNSDSSNDGVKPLLKRLAVKYGIQREGEELTDSYKQMFDGNAINTVDDLYTRTAEFIGFMLTTKKGRQAFSAMLARLNNLNAAHERQVKKDKKLTIRERRAVFYEGLKTPMLRLGSNHQGGHFKDHSPDSWDHAVHHAEEHMREHALHPHEHEEHGDHDAHGDHGGSGHGGQGDDAAGGGHGGAAAGGGHGGGHGTGH